MATERREFRVPLSEISQILERGLGGADAARAAGLEGFGRVRAAKASRLEREHARLSAKLGASHPRVVELSRKIDANRTIARHLLLETERARTEIPRVDAHTWVLHGRVRDRTLAGVADLTVALFDRKGTRLEQFGSAETDKTGYFKLVIGRDTEGPDEPRLTTGAGPRPRAQVVFVRIFDRSSNQVHADKRPLTPQPGRVQYIEIVLRDERGAGGPPPGPRPTRPDRPVRGTPRGRGGPGSVRP